jgi:hypothetical protein
MIEVQMLIENPKTEAELLQEFRDRFLDEVREERSKRLAKTDYIHLPDVSVSEEHKAAVLVYRQQLRDMPEVVDAWLKDKDIYSVSVWGCPWPDMETNA